MKLLTKNIQDAVSPVIGVMLMLVVVVIIAAVVSAFAGGLTQSTDKAPDVTISATFSQSKGMNIYHDGGETMEVVYINFLIRPDQIQSYAMRPTTYQINLTNVGNMDNSAMWCVLNAQSATIYQFKAGDVAHIAPANLASIQTLPDGTSDYLNSMRGMGRPDQVGTQWTLEMVDWKKGKTVATTKFTINP